MYVWVYLFHTISSYLEILDVLVTYVSINKKSQ